MNKAEIADAFYIRGKKVTTTPFVPCEQAALPVSHADVGKTNTITRISGKDEIQKHLFELGFNIGSNLTLINKTPAGVIVEVKGSRLALDKDLARRIYVC